MDYKEIREQIYEAANGMYVNAEDYVVAGIQIEDEFAEGKNCSKYYEYVYNAKQRLNDRLKTDEDIDVEIIISRMDDITREIAMKMFDYGVMIGSKGDK